MLTGTKYGQSSVFRSGILKSKERPLCRTFFLSIDETKAFGIYERYQ